MDDLRVYSFSLGDEQLGEPSERIAKGGSLDFSRLLKAANRIDCGHGVFGLGDLDSMLGNARPATPRAEEDFIRAHCG